MSRALIVFESMYGNNQKVAEAIAEGLRAAAPQFAAEVIEVNDAPDAIPTDVALLLVGGPNHALGMTRPRDRQDAKKHTEAPLVSSGIGLREWFDQLEQAPRSIPAAAWDTRIKKPGFMRWLDRASAGIEKRLRRRGFELATSAEHFFVDGTTGPLADGELGRARRWGEQLAATIPVRERASS